MQTSTNAVFSLGGTESGREEGREEGRKEGREEGREGGKRAKKDEPQVSKANRVKWVS